MKIDKYEYSTTDQADLVNNPNILENSGFGNQDLVDGRGLPKVGKHYELSLSLMQRHKDGLEKEFKDNFLVISQSKKTGTGFRF